MARYRRRGGTIYTTADVEIDVCDVLSEISDDDLLEEIKERKLEEKAKARAKLADPFDLLEDVMDCLRHGDAREALFLLDRILHPKFASVELCEKEFAKLRGDAAVKSMGDPGAA
jgi:ADP-dependent phosphofructokinase/glucokinase